MSTEKITLKASDGEEFVVEKSAVVISVTLKDLLDDCTLSTIPVTNVDGKTLARVIEYCKKHAEESDNNVLEQFDRDLVNIDQNDLYYLLNAANYLNIQGLLDAACQQVANMIKGKTPQQIRNIFNIRNDFTEAEEEEVRRENAWQVVSDE